MDKFSGRVEVEDFLGATIRLGTRRYALCSHRYRSGDAHNAVLSVLRLYTQPPLLALHLNGRLNGGTAVGGIVIVVICSVGLACGRDLGIHRGVVSGDCSFGSFLECGDNGRAGKYVCVCNLGPKRDAVVARGILLLHGFCCASIRGGLTKVTDRVAATYHQYLQTFGLRRSKRTCARRLRAVPVPFCRTSR